MALGSWQKLSRILPGQPFGNGVNGDYTSTSIPSTIYASCSGTAGSKTLNVSLANYTSFANGDAIFIHQSRGTGHGQNEINQIVSGGGTTTLTLKEDLHYTFTDQGTSGYTQAQITRIRMYDTINVSGGTWSVPTWRSNVNHPQGYDPAYGGIFVVAAKLSADFVNTVRINGENGHLAEPQPAYGDTGGYWGGYPSNGDQGTTTNHGSKGEGYNTSAWIHQYIANDSGGGGGKSLANCSGGGGGHAVKGGNGTYLTTGGFTQGNAELTSIHHGGGGGGGRTTVDSGDSTQGGGAAGGGIIVIIAKELTTTSGYFQARGGVGGGTTAPKGGGGGAGGSILLQADRAILGSNRVTAYGGAGGTSGGAGGTGRIALHYGSTYSGTTNPTVNATRDSTLQETGGSFIFNLL